MQFVFMIIITIISINAAEMQATGSVNATKGTTATVCTARVPGARPGSGSPWSTTLRTTPWSSAPMRGRATGSPESASATRDLK